jgi:hypothetical protein
MSKQSHQVARSTVVALCEVCKLRIAEGADLSRIDAGANAIILAMKRRAGVETDSQLAAFLAKDQSAVSHWRKRGAVPESAILRLERLTAAAA